MRMNFKVACCSLILGIGGAGCAKVGSPEWCDNMDDKPKGDWTGNEAGDYAKYCLLGLDPDKEQNE